MKHPKALYGLFFIEMWERFGYYFVMALMNLYLMNKYNMTEGEAGSLIGTTMMLAYFSPFIGGIIADRWLGYRKSVLIGSIFLGIGYTVLGMGTMGWVYTGMALMTIGMGAFKPNISTMVGNLYPDGDRRRDAAFSIFYMGINIGSLPTGFASAILMTHYGWQKAFYAAGIGMGISVVLIIACWDLLENADKPKEKLELAETSWSLTPVEKRRIAALGVMCLCSMMFWMGFHQNATGLVNWAEQATDLTFGGLFSSGVNPANFASANPIFVVLLTPIVAGLFGWLASRNKEPSNPTKIAIGMWIAGLSFVVLVWGSYVGGDTGRVSPWFLIGSYFVGTLGELCLSPMGLSMVTKLAPKRMTALCMGIWFLSVSIGSKLSGNFNVYWKTIPHHAFFGWIAAGTFVAALLVTIQLKWLSKAMPKVDNTPHDSFLPPDLSKTLTIGLVMPGQEKAATN